MNGLAKAKKSPSFFRPRAPGLAEISNLINLLPDPAFLLDCARLQICAVNPALVRLTAFPVTELLGYPIQKIIQEPGECQPGEKRMVNTLRSKRSPIAAELSITSLDQGGNWLLGTLVSLQLRSRDNWHQRIFTGMVEVSQMGLEEDLQAYLQRVAGIVQELIDSGLVCVYQARSGSAGLEKTASLELNGVSFPDFIPPSDLIRLQAPTVWSPGKRVQTDIHRAGRLAPLNYVASVPLGSPVAFSGLLVVGDAEKQPMDRLVNILSVLGAQIGSAMENYILRFNLRNDLAQKEINLGEYQSLLENLHTGILVLDPHLSITDANPEAEWMLGYARNEIIGQQWSNVLIGTDKLTPALEAALGGIATPNLGEVQLHRRSGQSFPVSMQIVPVMAGTGVETILVFVDDISEDQEIRARTQQLEQRAVLGEVTSVFAHGVRNPLNNVNLALELMAKKLPENDPMQEKITDMCSEIGRVDQLMESILSFSRQQVLPFEPLDLVAFCRSFFEKWRPRFVRSNIVPFFHADDKIPLINADPKSLDQVFTNLISNAVEAMRDSGGSLALKIAYNPTAIDGAMVEVTVSDNGPGIPEELQPKIFEPFVTHNKKKGTGLGLAITKRIANAHKGRIDFTSIPGATMFTVSIPAIVQPDRS